METRRKSSLAVLMSDGIMDFSPFNHCWIKFELSIFYAHMDFILVDLFKVVQTSSKKTSRQQLQAKLLQKSIVLVPGRADLLFQCVQLLIHRTQVNFLFRLGGADVA